MLEMSKPGKSGNLKGKIREEAEAALKELSLNLGNVDTKISAKPAEFDKVIDQDPPADTMITKGGSVDIVIAIKA